jgi:hypothetical protein
MEATFVLKPDELTTEWLKRLKSHFADTGIITITATGPEKPLSVEEQRTSQRELLKRMQSLRERMAQTQVTMPAGLDINDIIDGIND